MYGSREVVRTTGHSGRAGRLTLPFPRPRGPSRRRGHQLTSRNAHTSSSTRALAVRARSGGDDVPDPPGDGGQVSPGRGTAAGCVTSTSECLSPGQVRFGSHTARGPRAAFRARSPYKKVKFGMTKLRLNIFSRNQTRFEAVGYVRGEDKRQQTKDRQSGPGALKPEQPAVVGCQGSGRPERFRRCELIPAPPRWSRCGG